MKTLLAVALLALSGCSFDVGDCISIVEFKEDWEQPSVVWRIVGEGKFSYKVQLLGGSGMYHAHPGYLAARLLYKKVTCPDAQ